MNDVYFKASLQNTLNPEVGTFNNVNNKEGTFTLEDGEYYLTNNTSTSYGVYYPTENIYSVGFTIEFDINYDGRVDFGWCLAFNGDDSTYWFGVGVIRENLEFRGQTLPNYHLIASPNTWLHVKCIFDYDHNQNYVYIYIDNVKVNTFTISNNYGIKYIDILGNSGAFVPAAKIKNIIIYKNKNHYLDTTGLKSVWSKIKSLFATKTELASKANDSDVMHKSGDETIAGTKTFVGGSDSGLIALNTDTEHSLLFGVGSSGVNRGIYDNKNRRWSIFLDGTDYIMTQCPNPPAGDSSNKLATTGWVQTELDSATVTNATYANWLRTSSHSDHLFHTEWDNAGYFWTYVTAGNGDYRAVRVARSDSAATAQACTGNAATATKATQDSDGKQINTTYSKVGHTHDDRYYTEAEVNNLLKGKANTSGTYSNLTVGNASTAATAATATKLATARTIALSGAATGTATGFDGSGNITIPVTALAASSIRAQWYAAYPDGAEAHNAMWGGRDITAAFNNGTVSANIANGTFKDIFPGDYITKQITIPQVLADDGTTELFAGGTYTVNWVVADCDYWINKGDAPIMTAHHVAIVPQVPIFNARMNATNTTEGGYAGSEMYKNVIPACATGIVSAFGSDHILTFRDAISNKVDTSHVSSGIPQWTGTPGWWGEWVSVQCNLMSEKMVCGAPICSAGAMDNSVATRQMSAFRLSEKLINYNGQNWWLRDVVSSTRFAAVLGRGFVSAHNASLGLSIRPFALLV